jgi:hypothetical protein
VNKQELKLTRQIENVEVMRRTKLKRKPQKQHEQGRTVRGSAPPSLLFLMRLNSFSSFLLPGLRSLSGEA